MAGAAAYAKSIRLVGNTYEETLERDGKLFRSKEVHLRHSIQERYKLLSEGSFAHGDSLCYKSDYIRCLAILLDQTYAQLYDHRRQGPNVGDARQQQPMYISENWCFLETVFFKCHAHKYQPKQQRHPDCVSQDHSAWIPHASRIAYKIRCVLLFHRGERNTISVEQTLNEMRKYENTGGAAAASSASSAAGSSGDQNADVQTWRETLEELLWTSVCRLDILIAWGYQNCYHEPYYCSLQHEAGEHMPGGRLAAEDIEVLRVNQWITNRYMEPEIQQANQHIVWLRVPTPKTTGTNGGHNRVGTAAPSAAMYHSTLQSLDRDANRLQEQQLERMMSYNNNNVNREARNYHSNESTPKDATDRFLQQSFFQCFSGVGVANHNTKLPPAERLRQECVFPDMSTVWTQALQVVSRFKHTVEYHAAFSKYISRIYLRLALFAVIGEPVHELPMLCFQSALGKNLFGVRQYCTGRPAKGLMNHVLFNKRVMLSEKGERAQEVVTANRRFLAESEMVLRCLCALLHPRATIFSEEQPGYVNNRFARYACAPEVAHRFCVWAIELSQGPLQKIMQQEMASRIFPLFLDPTERERFIREDQFGDPQAYSVLARYKGVFLEKLVKWVTQYRDVMGLLIANRMFCIQDYMEAQEKEALGEEERGGIGMGRFNDDDGNDPTAALRQQAATCYKEIGDMAFHIESLAFEVLLKYVFHAQATSTASDRTNGAQDDMEDDEDDEDDEEEEEGEGQDEEEEEEEDAEDEEVYHGDAASVHRRRGKRQRLNHMSDPDAVSSRYSLSRMKEMEVSKVNPLSHWMYEKHRRTAVLQNLRNLMQTADEEEDSRAADGEDQRDDPCLVIMPRLVKLWNTFEVATFLNVSASSAQRRAHHSNMATCLCKYPEQLAPDPRVMGRFIPAFLMWIAMFMDTVSNKNLHTRDRTLSGHIHSTLKSLYDELYKEIPIRGAQPQRH